MTCIAAYKDHTGAIWVGSDMLASSIDQSVSRFETAMPKVFHLGQFTIGYAGCFRFGQIMQYQWTPPDPDPRLDDLCYMSSVVAESLSDHLEAHDMLKDSHVLDGGEALIAYKDSIYLVQDDFSVITVQRPFLAIGSGSDSAMGAMFAYSSVCDDDNGSEAVGIALRAAGHFSGVCGSEFVILKHGAKKPSRSRKPTKSP